MNPTIMEQHVTKETSPDVESRILQTLFDRLNQNSIRYCVLRNYASLPYTLDGSDIDMLIDPFDMNRAASVIESVVREFHGKRICDYAVHTHIVRYCGYVEGAWWSLPIDLFSDLEYRGLPYFDAQEVLHRARLHNDVRIASAEDACFIIFLKDLLFNDRARNGITEKAYPAYRQNEQVYKPLLENIFGKRSTEFLILCLSGKNEIYTRRSLAHRLRRSLSIRSLQRKPLWTLRCRCSNMIQRLGRLFRRPGFWVVVLGTDGSGKSTILDGIEPVMESALHNRIQHGHIRPHWLPSLARLFGQPEQQGPVSNPHESRPSGFLGSLFRLVYYSLDYTLGYWGRVYPSLVKRPALYVFDRYYYDFILDPRRVRLALPGWITRIMGAMIPKPDLILCLGADAEQIHARKPELPPKEIDRQVHSLKRFCAAHKRAFWIDTGGSIEQSLDQALEAITSAMASRYPMRQVSGTDTFWKILLPHPSFDGILTHEIEQEVLDGLKHCYDIVDATPRRPQYHMLVTGSNHRKEQIWLPLLDRIRKDGYFVFTGRYPGKRLLRKAGLTVMSRYAGLPAHRPRLFIPLQSAQGTNRGLLFHVPGSRKLRFTWSIVRFLARLGIQKPLHHYTITLCSRNRCTRQPNDLIAFLSKCLGYPIGDLVLYGGSDTPQRKTTVLALATDDGQDVVVKIADTDMAKKALKQETDALRKLADSPLTGQVPKLLFEDHWREYTLQVQQKCPLPSRRQIPTLTPIHTAFLVKLTEQGKQTIPIAQTSVWKQIQDAFDNRNGPVSLSVQQLLTRVLSDGFAHSPVICHRIHGDFAPWNIRLHREKIMVYDWEDSEPKGVAFTDTFHFLFRQAWLVGPWPGADAMIRKMRATAELLAEKAEIDRIMIDRALPLWALAQFLHAPSNPIVQIITFLGDEFVAKT